MLCQIKHFGIVFLHVAYEFCISFVLEFFGDCHYSLQLKLHVLRDLLSYYVNISCQVTILSIIKKLLWLIF